MPYISKQKLRRRLLRALASAEHAHRYAPVGREILHDVCVGETIQPVRHLVDFGVGLHPTHKYPVALNSFALFRTLLEVEPSLSEESGGAGRMDHVVEWARRPPGRDS
jgi:hypothetical protein